MKVILLQNIKGFGRIGDIKNVSDGYARNMLFPKKLAKPATESSAKEAELLKKQREAAGIADTESAKKAAAVIADTALEISKKASPAGTLFSSVTKQEVAKELSKKSGTKITPDMLNFGEAGEHIKHAGSHFVIVETAPGIKAETTITINGIN